MSFSLTQSGKVSEVREGVKADAAAQDGRCPEPFLQAIDHELAKLDQDRPIALSAHGHSWSDDQLAGNIDLHLTVSVPNAQSVGG